MIGTYYTFTLQEKTGWGKAFPAYWKGDMIDNWRQEIGRIFDNAAAAERGLASAQAKWRAERELKPQQKLLENKT